jgi:hypothetical protein
VHYGVDLNPLAVELAKLSLWLTTIATDRPLNFLDHHFCCGNSLVGARISDLGHVPELRKRKDKGFKFTWKITDNLLGAAQKAVRNVKQIEERVSETVSDVKNKEKIWSDSVRPALRPFRSVANLWLACFFGNDLPERDYEALIDLLDIHPDKIRPWKNAAEFQEIVMGAVTKGELKLAGRDFDKNQLKNLCAFLIRAEKSAHERRFFHWELEFPEVFFNDDGTPRELPGFDAVIGNPPYVRIQGFSRSDIDYIMHHFESATGNVDLYVSFIERGFRLLRVDGRLGEIVPNKFLRTDYGVGLRNLIADRNALNQLVDFGASQVFGVTIYTCLLFLDYHENQTLRYAEVEAKPESLNGVIFRELSSKLLHQHPWVFSDNEAASLIDKIGANSLRLLDLPADMSRGSSTGDDEVFVIENEDVEEEVCRTPIFASDFGRYNFDPAKRWKIIFPYVFRNQHYELRTEAELESRFPKAFAHLHRARQKLEKRKQFREWHAYSAPRNLELHDRAQIIVPLLAERGLFAFIPTDTRGALCPMASGGFTITVGESCVHDPRYVLALINSRLLFWKLERLSNVFRGGWITCTKQYFGELPIRRIAFTTPATKRAAQIAKATRLYEKSLAGGDA